MPDTFLFALTALFSVVNPLGAVPVFLALTEGDTEKRRQQQTRLTAFYMLGIMLVFFWGGSYILNFFGITVDGMRIAGGLIIVRSGFDLMNAKSKGDKAISKKAQMDAKTRNDIAFSPMAMPILAGPGSIAFLIGLAKEKSGLTANSSIVGAIFAIAILTFFILSYAPKLMSFLGESGASAMSKMMGFISLCIGVQFVINGVKPILAVIGH